MKATNKMKEICQNQVMLPSIPVLASAMFVAGICLTTSGCRCLRVPDSDATPPGAVLTVEFTDFNTGRTASLNAGAAGSSITVDASASSPVYVMYTGLDSQGLKRVKLLYDMRNFGPGSVSQPLLTPIEVNANCPKSSLVGTKEFSGWDYYKFSAQSENWVGTTAQTGEVIVNVK